MKIGISADEIAPGQCSKTHRITGKRLKRRLGHECEALVIVDNGSREKFPKIYNFHLKDAPIR